MVDPKYADCECEGCKADKEYWFKEPCSRCSRMHFKREFQLWMFCKDYYVPKEEELNVIPYKITKKDIEMVKRLGKTKVKGHSFSMEDCE